LLGVHNAQSLYTHALGGALFETLIMAELHKYYYNQGKQPPIYVWRDVQSHEIDCIIETSFDELITTEIKSGMTIMSGSFKELIKWRHIACQSEENSFLIYAQVRKIRHALMDMLLHGIT
jgi:predicted AAA+ superfamily ATPase